MAKRFKSFGGTISTPKDPIEFELFGETFQCKAALQGRTLLNFVRRSDSDNYSETAEAILDFLDSCIAPQDRERFREFTSDDSQEIVDMSVISDIATWLVELYSGGGEDEAGKEEDSTVPVLEPSSNGQTDITSMSEVEPSSIM